MFSNKEILTQCGNVTCLLKVRSISRYSPNCALEKTPCVLAERSESKLELRNSTSTGEDSGFSDGIFELIQKTNSTQ